MCIDIDNTIGDFTGALREWCRNKYGDRYAYPEPTDYRCWENEGWPWKTVEDYLADYLHAVGEGVFLLERPYPHAIETLERLQRNGWVIILSTARSLSAAEDTVRWIDVHRIPHSGLHFGDKTQITADVYVDDNPTTLDRLSGRGTLMHPDHAYAKQSLGFSFSGWDTFERTLTEIQENLW